MPEWSKGYDSSSYGVSLVGSNPTSRNSNNSIMNIPTMVTIDLFYIFYIYLKIKYKIK